MVGALTRSSSSYSAGIAVTELQWMTGLPTPSTPTVTAKVPRSQSSVWENISSGDTVNARISALNREGALIQRVGGLFRCSISA